MGPSPGGAVAAGGARSGVVSEGHGGPARRSRDEEPTAGGCGVGGSRREGVGGGRPWFGVRGSAGGRGWGTCPQPCLAESERGAGGVSYLGAGPGGLGWGARKG